MTAKLSIVVVLCTLQLVAFGFPYSTELCSADIGDGFFNPILAPDPGNTPRNEGTRRCHRSSNGTSVNARTLCPWTWTLNFNPFRTPSAYQEAVCDCDVFEDHVGRPLLRCEPLRMKLATKRKDESHPCGERRMEESIRVACVPLPI